MWWVSDCRCKFRASNCMRRVHLNNIVCVQGGATCRCQWRPGEQALVIWASAGVLSFFETWCILASKGLWRELVNLMRRHYWSYILARVQRRSLFFLKDAFVYLLVDMISRWECSRVFARTKLYINICLFRKATGMDIHIIFPFGQ